MHFRNPLRSLKTRVTLVTSAVWLVSLWLLALTVSAWQLHDLKVTLGTNQLSGATIIAGQVTHQILDRIRSLEAVADSVTSEDWSSTEKLQAFLDGKSLFRVLFNAGGYFADLEGTATASVPLSAERRGMNFLSRNHVRTALVEGEPAVGDIVVGAALGVPVFSIAVPVSNQEGQIIGCLVGVTDLTQPNFLDEITNNKLGQTGGYLLVHRTQRLIVTATDKSRIMEKLAGPGVNPEVDRFLNGEDGWQVLTNARGVEVLAAAKQIPVAGWYIAAATPTAEAFHLIANLQMQLLYLVFFLTVLTGALNWFLLKRQLTPVVSTIKTLTQLTASDQPLHPLPVTRHDEIGDLIESFNSLLRTVEKREEERARYETLIAQSQRLEALGVLAGGIAHDFNNLLAGIFGNIELALLKDSQGPAALYLTRTLDTLGRAKGLTQQLITFSKGGEPDLKTAALFPFAEETAQFALSGSNVLCRVEVPSQLWPCRYDRNQLGQAIDNLVINAQQAMVGGGTVTLSARNHYAPDGSRWVELSVTDTGPGIPASILEHVFEPFFSTKAAGHGLGLATTFSIVKKHGGALWVESVPGQGATFRLTLPADADPGAPVAQTPAGHRGTGTLLIMDDEVSVGQVLADLLTSFGYGVIRTESGAQAIEALRCELAEGRTVAAAILDMTIPGGMGGLEALEHLRRLDPRLKAVVSSGFTEAPVLSDPSRYGFTAALRKPYQRDDLERALNLVFGPRATDVERAGPGS